MERNGMSERANASFGFASGTGPFLGLSESARRREGCDGWKGAGRQQAYYVFLLLYIACSLTNRPCNSLALPWPCMLTFAAVNSD